MEKEEEVSKCIQIQGPEYVIRNSQGFRWDLYLLKVVNKNKKDVAEKFAFKLEGYGLTLERCIEKIISYRTKLRGKSLRKGDEDLIKMMKLWLEEKTKLLSVMNFSEEEWNKITCLNRIPLDKLMQRDLIEAKVVTEDDDDDTEDNEEEES